MVCLPRYPRSQDMGSRKDGSEAEEERENPIENKCIKNAGIQMKCNNYHL